MPRKPPPARDGSFLAFVASRLEARQAELTAEVMAGLEDHGRYRDRVGRAAGIGEASEILLECWNEFGREDDDEG